MTKLKNKGFLKLTALFIAVLFAHSAVMAESVPPFASVTSSPAAVYFQVYSINFSGLPDNPLQIECPEDISTYTDINECTAEISDNLNIIVTSGTLASLTWEMTGANTDASRRTGINQIESYIFNEGTTIVNYTARDKSGTTVSCSFSVTISDNQVPKIVSAPENIAVEADENECGATVTWDEPVVVDNCTPDYQILKTSTHVSGSFFPVGTTNVTYILDDGMATTQVVYSFTVTVTDRAAPAVTAPENITVNCGEPLPRIYSSFKEFTEAGGAATDNCQLKASSFTLKSQTQSSQICPYTVTRTYQVSDVYNNVGTVEHLIFVGEPIKEPIIEPVKEEIVTLKSGMADFTAALSGNWSEPATWGGGAVPGSGDNVTIPAGITVNIDQNVTNLASLTISGILQFEALTARTLSSALITVNSGGIFRSAQSGTIKSHSLIAQGDIINKGTIDFSSSSNNTGVEITFTGSSNNEFNCQNATLTNLKQTNGVILNKGTTVSSILSYTPGGTFQVLSDASATAKGFLVINNGTFKITGTNVFSNPVFNIASYIIPATGGFWLGNDNATVLGQFGTVDNNGELKISAGTFNIGTASGNSSVTNNNGKFELSDGTVNIAGRFQVSGASATITGGVMNLSSLGNGDANEATFHVTLASNLTISGSPLITFTRPNSNSVPFNDIEILSGSGTKTITGGTFQMGTALTTVPSTFKINSDIPLNNFTVFNSNSSILLTDNLTVNNQLTMNGGNINTSSQTLILNGSTSSSLSYASGMVVGKLQRTVAQAGVNYIFPVGDGTNSSTLQLNFASVNTQGTVTASSNGILPAGFLLNPTTVDASAFITNSTVGFSTVSGSFQLPTGFNPLQKVGLYNSSWSYQPAMASVGFSGWTALTNSAFALADCTEPTITLGANPIICEGTLSVNLPYSATTNSPNEYRIDFTDNSLDVNWKALTASPIILAIPPGTAPNSYSGDIYVRNAAVCESAGAGLSVTINPQPVGTNGTAATCSGVALNYNLQAQITNSVA
ncbi:MAG: HYR domain-containing, partial [Prolixibacteraceae bacterium]